MVSNILLANVAVADTKKLRTATSTGAVHRTGKSAHKQPLRKRESLPIFDRGLRCMWRGSSFRPLTATRVAFPCEIELFWEVIKYEPVSHRSAAPHVLLMVLFTSFNNNPGQQALLVVNDASVPSKT